MAARSPFVFTKVYLENNCHAEFSRMHKEVFAHLEEMTYKRKARLAIAAPRGHAKSTIVSLAYVLWCMLYEKERLILIVSNSTEQAATLLKDVKHQLKENHLLIADFSEICRGKKPKPWRDDRIQLPNGAMICILLPFKWLMELGSIDSGSHFVGAADETTSMDTEGKA